MPESLYIILKRSSRTITIVCAFFLSTTWFNFIWCKGTPDFAEEFSAPEMWAWTLSLSLLGALPTVLSKRVWPSLTILVLLDIFLMSNLMYFQSFGTQIPLGSYAHVYNLLDFTDAVADSLDTTMLLFPAILISTCIATLFLLQYQPHKHYIYFATLAISATLTIFLFLYPKPACARIATLHHTHGYHCTTTTRFSPAADLISQLIERPEPLNTKNRQHIDSIISINRKDLTYTTMPSHKQYKHLVFVIMESLESWPIGIETEGHTLTPRINELIADSTTLFIPHIRPEVGDGRSIDAQLILLCGLLPPDGQIYSFTYPGNRYRTLIHAFKEKYNAYASIMTTDLPQTYNQKAISRSFGFDTMISRSSFPNASTHLANHIGDLSFLRHSARKLDSIRSCHNGMATATMLVTYSCHVPYRIPRDCSNPIKFSEKIPAKLARYMHTVHYSDNALGEFIDSLRQRSDFDSTLIVITGDHHTFNPAKRRKYANTFAELDTAQHVPLIIINPPIACRITDEIGQSRIYPTLLQMLGMNDFDWPGTAFSIFSKKEPHPEAHLISDLILRYDLLRKTSYKHIVTIQRTR